MSNNTYCPPEFINLNGYSLQLRPTNCERFALEPFRLDKTDFSVKGLKNGKHSMIKYVKEGVENEPKHWFTCQLNKVDGWSDKVRTLERKGKTPLWFEKSGYFNGDCHFTSTKADDIRKHFLSRHTNLSSCYLDRCPITECKFSEVVSTVVRNHMDSCPLIFTWAENGFDPKSLHPVFLDDLEHWTGVDTGGKSFKQKISSVEKQERLEKVKLKISQYTNNVNSNSESKAVSVSTLNVNIASSAVGSEVNSTFTQSVSICDPAIEHDIKLASTQSVSNQSEHSGMEVRSVEVEYASDDELYAPDSGSSAQASYPVFNVKEEPTVKLLATNSDYRNGLDHGQKDEVMMTLAMQLLEVKGLLRISGKLIKLKRDCELRGVEMDAFWDLWHSVNKRLTYLNVKSEESSFDGDVETFFPIGELTGDNVVRIVSALNTFQKTISEFSPPVFTLDEVDKDDQIKELRELTHKKSEEFQANIVQLLMREKEIKKYKENLEIVKKKVSKEKEKVEKERIKKESARKESESLSKQLKREKEESVKKLKDLEALNQENLKAAISKNNTKGRTLTEVNIFQNVEFPSSVVSFTNGELSGSYAVNTQAHLDEMARLEKERKESEKEKRIENRRKAQEEKDKKMEKRRIALKEKEELKKHTNQWKHNGSKRSIGPLFASPHSEEPKRKRAKKDEGCSSHICEGVKFQYDSLLKRDKQMVIALGICYRQLVCSQIFCQYVTPYLLNKGSLQGIQMYELFARILPSYVKIFCGQDDVVSEVMLGREDEAWGCYVDSLQPFHRSYLFCQLYGQSEYVKDVNLNLCIKCGPNVASHPPGACGSVSDEMNSAFNTIRATEVEEWNLLAEAWISANKI